jgi:DNA polymerase-3 subunit gamma/tau
MAAAPMPDGAPVMRGLEDIAILALKNGAPVLKVHIENDNQHHNHHPPPHQNPPTPPPPPTHPPQHHQRLRDWTGVRWTVSISNEAGQPTVADQKRSAKAARIESVMQAPVVRAVLDRFPGAEIVAVRDIAAPEVAPEAPDASDN